MYVLHAMTPIKLHLAVIV
jgi:hypothetical protein